MQVTVSRKMAYGPISDSGSCGVWTSCVTLPGDYTIEQARALLGTVVEGGRVCKVWQHVPGGVPAYMPLVATDDRDLLPGGACYDPSWWLVAPN